MKELTTLLSHIPNIKEANVNLLIGFMSHLRILLAFFSWTGNTRFVAQEISQYFSINNQVDICEIQPKKSHGYFYWLLLSLIPGFKIKNQFTINNISDYDLLILGSPKWTFNSPPISEYLNCLIGYNNKMIALFITFGGYGEKKYVHKLEKKLIKKGLRPIASLYIKRNSINKHEYHKTIISFCNNIESIAHKKNLKQVK